jgi:hypothetical protein
MTMMTTEEKFAALTNAVLAKVQAFAEARRKRKTLQAERQEKMAAWYAWKQAEEKRINDAYDAAALQILGPGDPLGELVKAEQDAQQAAEQVYGAAWLARKALLHSGLELEPMQLPDGVTCRIDLIGNVVAPDLVPAIYRSPDPKLIKPALDYADVPGVTVAAKVSFTVR